MNNEELRKELIHYLIEGRTHASFLDAVGDMPEEAMNKKVEGYAHTPWMILEHLRISQFDMVDFTQNPDYKEIEWPKDYWPAQDQKVDKAMWQGSVNAFQKDMETLKEIVQNPANDLFAKIPWGSGQTIMREVLQIIDHNSYHLGQLIIMRKVLGAWKEE